MFGLKPKQINNYGPLDAARDVFKLNFILAFTQLLSENLSRKIEKKSIKFSEKKNQEKMTFCSCEMHRLRPWKKWNQADSGFSSADPSQKGGVRVCVCLKIN